MQKDQGKNQTILLSLGGEIMGEIFTPSTFLCFLTPYNKYAINMHHFYSKKKKLYLRGRRKKTALASVKQSSQKHTEKQKCFLVPSSVLGVCASLWSTPRVLLRRRRESGVGIAYCWSPSEAPRCPGRSSSCASKGEQEANSCKRRKFLVQLLMIIVNENCYWFCIKQPLQMANIFYRVLH